ncbi:MAG TPA: efflux RND transporter periplasmic adaptor subunit [Candidatus Acidoferrales bacterium]|nr:efflux RND transporter periplasmic adaptor subunit [Candidatus Acidoferrales bacterium]
MATNRKKKRIFILSGAGLLVVILVAAIVIGGKKEPVIMVQTEKVVRRTITQVVTASGDVEPKVLVKISPEVSGEIVDLPVVEGQRVDKGQVIVKIRPDTYIAQLQQSQANLQSMLGQQDLAKANYDNSSSTYKRAQELYKKNLMSDQDLESAKTQYDVNKATYESAKANVASAKALLDQTQDALSKTTIHAPMDGIVSVLNSKLGERVVGTSMMAGTEIMDVADMKSMEAQVNVDENDVVLVAVGDTSTLSVDAFPDKKIKGVVYQIASSGTTTGAGTQDQVTNFLVKIRIIQSEVDLKPAMSVTADIQTATHLNVLSVPIQSVTVRMPKASEGKGQGEASSVSDSKANAKHETVNECVFIVDKGVAKTVTVKRGIADDNYVEITSGLKGDEEVVSGNFVAISRELNDGSKVRIDNNKSMATKAIGG